MLMSKGWLQLSTQKSCRRLKMSDLPILMAALIAAGALVYVCAVMYLVYSIGLWCKKMYYISRGSPKHIQEVIDKVRGSDGG